MIDFKQGNDKEVSAVYPHGCCLSVYVGVST